jgi:hypothetical protein
MGDELLHSPTPIGQGPRRGTYIVEYYEIVAGVEVDRLRRRPNVRTSQNSVTEKFAQTTREAASTGVWDGG